MLSLYRCRYKMINLRLLSLSTTRIARGNKIVIEEIPTYNSNPSEKIITTNIAPNGSMRLFNGVLEEFYIQQMRMSTKTSKLIPKNTPEWDEKMKSIEEKLLKQCETGLTRRLALTSGVITSGYAGAALVYYMLGSIEAAEILIWGMCLNVPLIWLVINASARRKGVVHGLYFDEVSGSTFLMVDACGPGKKDAPPNYLIKIPHEHRNFEIHFDQNVGEASEILKQKPKKTIDKFIFTILKTKYVNAYKAKEKAAAFIVFKDGLDLSSPFGDLSQFVLAVPTNVLESAVNEATDLKNPGYIISEFRKSILNS